MADQTSELLIPDLIDLIASRDLRALRDTMRGFDPADSAQLLHDMIDAAGVEAAAIAYRVLPRDDAADVFAHLHADTQEALIAAFGTERSARILESMDADDRARLLDELPAHVAQRIIASLDPQTRAQTQTILGYPDESVGRLMTPDYVRVKPQWTVADALSHIRRFGKDAETVHWVFVTDADGRLVDDIHIRKLLLADPDATVESILDGRFLALAATDDREEAVRQMNRYDRTALPVVDSRGLLVGIVTVDDVADVAEEEATEDIHKLGGLEALDEPYLATTLREMFAKRAPWLAALFLMQLLTIGVMSFFGEQLDKAVILAVFVPLIISSGGNTGTQAASLLVRALALEEVRPADWVRVLSRELTTGLVMGSMLGVLGVAVVLAAELVGLAPTEHPLRVAFVVGTALVGIVMWGSLAGSLLPLALQRLGMDPAASSSPLVATIMDVSGLTIYFVVAVIFLRGTVL